LDRPPNPYQSPNSQDDKSAPPGAQSTPRLSPLLVSAGFGIFSGIIAYQLLLVFGFATLIHPKTPHREWWRIYADRVLFSGGGWQIIILSLFLWACIFSAVACLLYLSRALIRRPSVRFSLIASGCVAGIATLFVIGSLLILRM
jgi:hypothetical protein